MSDKEKIKKYYWIKLKQSLMTSDKVDYLMSQKDGANYVVLYQCLCLMCVNTNGVLGKEVGEILIPYDAHKIQRETKWFTLDTILVALELYKKLGLIYQQENGLYQIEDFNEIIGGETKWAEYKRKKLENFQKDSKKIPTQFQQEIDIEIEKDIDIDINNINNTITTTNNINRTKDELLKLVSDALEKYKITNITDAQLLKFVEGGCKDSDGYPINDIETYLINWSARIERREYTNGLYKGLKNPRNN